MRTLTLKVSLAALLLAATAASAGARQLSLPVDDLVYDPGTHRIYASVPSSAGVSGNSITAIDPETGQIGPSIFVGSEPDKLALSDDGQYLYVGLDGAGAVRRFDVATQSAGLQFSLGADSFFGPYEVGDLAVMPGSPHTVAVARINPSVSAAYAGVAVYDDGVPRGKMTGRQDGVDVIAFSSSPNRLYGYNNENTEFGFRRMTVDADGVTVDDVTDNLISGFGVDIRYDQGLLFSSSGREIDPEARALLGSFSGVGNGALVAPDVPAGRVYFLTGSGPVPDLRVYDTRTFLLLAVRAIPGVMGRLHSLIRWGQERADGGGLAFATDQGQVFLLSLSMLDALPPDFSLTVSPNSATGEGTATATVSLVTPAPPGGLAVDLASSDPAAAAPPPYLLVPGGAMTASVPVPVHAVTTATDVVITASVAGLTRTAALHLNAVPPPPAHLPVLSADNPVQGGMTAQGQIFFFQPAGGETVTLSSSNPAAATVPASVTVMPRATSATFLITTFPVTSLTFVTITARVGGVSVTGVVEILPVAAPAPPPGPPSAPPIVPPAAPAGLTALALAPTRVLLAWRDQSSNETGFALQRRTAGADWAPVGAVPPNTTTFADTGVTPGTAVTYRVRAVNDSGASDWSNELTVTPPLAIAPTSYTITDLGVLNGIASGAMGINNAGHVAGWVSLDATNEHLRAFLYDASGMHDLGPADSQYSIARGINAHDQIVGDSDAVPLAGFLWDDRGFHPLGAIGILDSNAMGVNDNGQVVGTIYHPSNHAFLWSADHMVDLGTLGGFSSDAHGINNRGQVVGQSFTSGNRTFHAFLYDGTGMHDLGTLGGTSSVAFAINDEGQVVGQSATAGDRASHAFLWDRTGWHDLGTLGGSNSVGHAINEAGWVVGNAYTPIDTYDSSHAFLYADGPMRDLNALIPAGSGWVLRDAAGINDAGQIVGQGIRLQDGSTHAYLLNPRWPSPP